MDLREQVPGAEASQFRLLTTRRFLPFFLTQFFGAFNAAGQAGMLSNLAQGLFILPFFLLSAIAGQIADKYEKSGVIRGTRLAEVFLMVGGAAALYFAHVPSLLLVIFLMGLLAT